MPGQIQQMEVAGVKIFTSNDAAARFAGRLIAQLDPQAGMTRPASLPAVDLQALHQPLAAINVGLETFTESLTAQAAQAIQVDWRPPASGDERLMAILARMKGK